MPGLQKNIYKDLAFGSEVKADTYVVLKPKILYLFCTKMWFSQTTIEVNLVGFFLVYDVAMATSVMA